MSTGNDKRQNCLYVIFMDAWEKSPPCGEKPRREMPRTLTLVVLKWDYR